MEFGVSLRAKHILLTLVFATILTWGLANAENRRLVLVSGEHADIHQLTKREVRKLYMGHLIINEKNNVKIAPFINVSDPLLHQVFLQKIMFMSGRSYDRHMLSKAFRLGGVRPRMYKKLSSLIMALKNNKNAVSYMWGSAVNKNEGIKVVIELWFGQIE